MTITIMRISQFAFLSTLIVVLSLPIIGSSNKRHTTECDAPEYRNNVLKLVRESPFAGLFKDMKNHTKFEASGVAAVQNKFYVVFDSSNSIGQLDETFAFRGPENKLIGDKGEEDSQFEGIAYVPENDTYLLLHEALPVDASMLLTSATEKDTKRRKRMVMMDSRSSLTQVSPNDDNYVMWKPYITTVKLRHGDGYDIIQKCPVEFEITSSNKGFESILYIKNNQGQSFLLGLCEGNYCKGGSVGKERGNGRIIVSQLEENSVTGECVWQTVKVVDIPSSALFMDCRSLLCMYIYIYILCVKKKV